MNGAAHFKTHVHIYSGFGRVYTDDKEHWGVLTKIHHHHFADYNYTPRATESIKDNILERMTHQVEIQTDKKERFHFVFLSKRQGADLNWIPDGDVQKDCFIPFENYFTIRVGTYLPPMSIPTIDFNNISAQFPDNGTNLGYNTLQAVKRVSGQGAATANYLPPGQYSDLAPTVNYRKSGWIDYVSSVAGQPYGTTLFEPDPDQTQRQYANRSYPALNLSYYIIKGTIPNNVY